ncbi:MAG TPA: hypothetical protein VFO65_03535 [Acidimicrobiales bacterium]|nr:hypothetical protein [Acidimicrobiales bacterium]
MRMSGGILRVVVAAVSAAVLSTAWPSPARAGIFSVDPVSAQVVPGETVRITVWVESATFLCLTTSIEPPDQGVAFSVDVPCAIGRWRARVTVRAAATAPLGTYVLRLADAEAAYDVAIEVVAWLPPTTTTAPPDPEPTTTAVVTTVPPTSPTTEPPGPTTVPGQPTTTAPGATTTTPPSGPTSTAPGGGPTTTEAPGSGGGAGSGDAGGGGTGTGTGTGSGTGTGTGSGSGSASGTGAGGPAAVAGIVIEREPSNVDARVVLGRPDGGSMAADELAAPGAPAAATVVAAFRPLAALARLAPPVEGLFLPFRSGPAARRCLPLTDACGVAGGGLVLAPPASIELRWAEPAGDFDTLSPLGGRGVPALEPVGMAPENFAAVNFLLPVLDLGAGNGQVKGLPRGLDASGRFGPPATDRQAVPPLVEGAGPAAGARALLASAPFDRPYELAAAALVEAFPAVVVFSGRRPTPLFGLRTDPAWALDVSFVPLLGTGAPPFLGRTDDGRTGLFVALPDGVDAPAEARVEPSGQAAADAGGDDAPADGGAVSGLGLPLLVPLGVLVAGGALVAWWRRRNGAAGL